MEEKLHNIGFGNYFLDIISKAQATKEQFDNFDFFKIKNVWKDTINRIKRHRMGENIANYIFDKEYIQAIWRTPITQTTNNQFKTWANDLTRPSSKKDMQMDNKHIKRYPTSLPIMKMKSNPQWYTTSIRMTII